MASRWNMSDVQQWSVESGDQNVVAWATGAGLSADNRPFVVEFLRSRRVTGGKLLMLNEEKLIGLGMPFGPAGELGGAVEALTREIGAQGTSRALSSAHFECTTPLWLQVLLSGSSAPAISLDEPECALADLTVCSSRRVRVVILPLSITPTTLVPVASRQ